MGWKTRHHLLTITHSFIPWKRREKNERISRKMEGKEMKRFVWFEGGRCLGRSHDLEGCEERTVWMDSSVTQVSLCMLSITAKYSPHRPVFQL